MHRSQHRSIWISVVFWIVHPKKFQPPVFRSRIWITSVLRLKLLWSHLSLYGLWPELRQLGLKFSNAYSENFRYPQDLDFGSLGVLRQYSHNPRCQRNSLVMLNLIFSLVFSLLAFIRSSNPPGIDMTKRTAKKDYQSHNSIPPQSCPIQLTKTNSHINFFFNSEKRDADYE